MCVGDVLRVKSLVQYRGTSVKRTVDPSQLRTARTFFTETVAPVNTDVSRAVSPGTFAASFRIAVLSIGPTAVLA